ncbi:hypothetical protein F4678DRAFT_426666 [Xylaria arbuscula]|nr:hypothetical protein F4678DRAFT_426666 [Xylaria arbuscula]
MRFSPRAIAALLIASSCPLSLASASANADPKPDTTPNLSTPTKTATVKPRETTPSLLSALYQVANSFNLRACIPQALPLVTTLPRIPPGLLAGGAIGQALSQTHRELSDVCEFSVTGSVGDTFTSFLPEWYSWYNRYSDRVAKLVTKCPKAGDLVRTVEAYESCSQVVAVVTAAGASVTASDTTSTTTASRTDTAGGVGNAGGAETTAAAEPSETTSSTDSPSAARETGLLGAAAGVAAGLLGVAAIL